MNNQNGFSMIEVVISVALLGLVVVGLLDGLALTAKTVPLVDEKITGLNLAESQMEFVRTQSYTDGVPPGAYDTIDITDFPGFSIDTVVSLVDDESISAAAGDPLDDDDDLQQIVVTVSYITGGGTRTVAAELETRRCNPQI